MKSRNIKKQKIHIRLKKEAYSSRAATNKQIGIASKPMIKQKMIKEKRKFK